MKKRTKREKARASFTLQAKDTAECVVVPLAVIRGYEARIQELEAAAAPPPVPDGIEWTFTEYDKNGGKSVVVLTAEQAAAVKLLLAATPPVPEPPA